MPCPICGQKNRLYQRSSRGIYSCGACRATLVNPFVAPPKKPGPAKRAPAFFAASIFGILLVIVMIIAVASPQKVPSHQTPTGSGAERDARVDKLISELGTLPLIPRPGYLISQQAYTPVPVSQPIPAVSRTAALPITRPITEIPTNNVILFDAFPSSNSRSELTVSNGTSRHAIAKLVDLPSARKILSFAVCAGRTATVQAIPDGSYSLIFAFGDRLSRNTDRFESPQGFSKFRKLMAFTTRKTSEAMYWDQLSITLHPVFGGNARTQSISRKEFERY